MWLVALWLGSVIFYLIYRISLYLISGGSSFGGGDSGGSSFGGGDSGGGGAGDSW
jgi:uncharacterized protein